MISQDLLVFPMGSILSPRFFCQSRTWSHVGVPCRFVPSFAFESSLVTLARLGHECFTRYNNIPTSDWCSGWSFIKIFLISFADLMIKNLGELGVLWFQISLMLDWAVLIKHASYCQKIWFHKTKILQPFHNFQHQPLLLQCFNSIIDSGNIAKY